MTPRPLRWFHRRAAALPVARPLPAGLRLSGEPTVRVSLRGGGHDYLPVGWALLDPVPAGVDVEVSDDPFPTVTVTREGYRVGASWNPRTGRIREFHGIGVPDELKQISHEIILNLLRLIVDIGVRQIEDGAMPLLERIACGHPALPLEDALHTHTDHIADLIRPHNIRRLWLIDDSSTSLDSKPLVVYETRDRRPLPWNGITIWTHLVALTGTDFEWRARYPAEDKDALTGQRARLVWKARPWRRRP